MIYIPELNCVYYDIFKAGSTSIKLMLALATGRQVKQENEVHWISDWFAPYNDYSKCFKFTFVRNPWDRLASVWYQKFSRPDCEHVVCHQQDDQRFYLGMPFDRFARLVVSLRDVECNPHYKQQSSCITGPVDFVGRFENLNPGWRHICNQLGISLPLPIGNESSPRPHYSSLYTDELADLVGARYQSDISGFGYCFKRVEYPIPSESTGPTSPVLTLE